MNRFGKRYGFWFWFAPEEDGLWLAAPLLPLELLGLLLVLLVPLLVPY